MTAAQSALVMLAVRRVRSVNKYCQSTCSTCSAGTVAKWEPLRHHVYHVLVAAISRHAACSGDMTVPGWDSRAFRRPRGFKSR